MIGVDELMRRREEKRDLWTGKPFTDEEWRIVQHSYEQDDLELDTEACGPAEPEHIE